MARTAEGKVKKYVRTMLEDYKPKLWYFMPVPGMFGGKTLDFLGAYHGMFFTIETKQPGEQPTDFQNELIAALNVAEVASFVISGGKDYPIRPLIDWLEWVKFHHLNYQGPFYSPVPLKMMQLTGR